MRRRVGKGSRTFHEADVSSSLFIIAGERCMLAPLKEERVSHHILRQPSVSIEWEILHILGARGGRIPHPSNPCRNRATSNCKCLIVP